MVKIMHTPYCLHNILLYYSYFLLSAVKENIYKNSILHTSRARAQHPENLVKRVQYPSTNKPRKTIHLKQYIWYTQSRRDRAVRTSKSFSPDTDLSAKAWKTYTNLFKTIHSKRLKIKIFFYTNISLVSIWNHIARITTIIPQQIY